MQAMVTEHELISVVNEAYLKNCPTAKIYEAHQEQVNPSSGELCQHSIFIYGSHSLQGRPTHSASSDLANLVKSLLSIANSNISLRACFIM